MAYDIRYSLLLSFKIPINIYSTIDQKYYKFVYVFLYIISFLSFILFRFLSFILFRFLSFILFPLFFLLFPLYRFLDGFFFNYIMPRRIFDDWWPRPKRFPNIPQEQSLDHWWEHIANPIPSHLFSDSLWPHPTRPP